MDLKKLIENGKFREDLYYRLNVLPVNVPPLRDRIKDIKPLIDYFLEKINRNMAGHITGFDKKAMEVLTAYSWPGNIRELKNLVEREVSLKQEGKVSVTDLPVEILINRARKNGYDDSMVSSRVHMEKKLIEKALLETKGNQVKASRLLGIHRNTMRAKIRQMKIKNHEIPPGSGAADMERA
jgi:transcriptional regulator with PAS, ATPase and Fis domain